MLILTSIVTWMNLEDNCAEWMKKDIKDEWRFKIQIRQVLKKKLLEKREKIK